MPQTFLSVVSQVFNLQAAGGRTICRLESRRHEIGVFGVLRWNRACGSHILRGPMKLALIVFVSLVLFGLARACELCADRKSVV